MVAVARPKLSFTIAEATASTGYSVGVIRRAVRAGDLVSVAPTVDGRHLSRAGHRRSRTRAMAQRWGACMRRQPFVLVKTNLGPRRLHVRGVHDHRQGVQSGALRSTGATTAATGREPPPPHPWSNQDDAPCVTKPCVGPIHDVAERHEVWQPSRRDQHHTPRQSRTETVRASHLPVPSGVVAPHEPQNRCNTPEPQLRASSTSLPNRKE